MQDGSILWPLNKIHCIIALDGKDIELKSDSQSWFWALKNSVRRMLYLILYF